MIPISKTSIRDFTGKTIGYIEEDKDGNRQCREFTGKILGYYDKKANVTREFTGKIVSIGDTTVSFLYKGK